MGIITDSHTHSWSSTCKLADKVRYTPTKAHTIDMLFNETKEMGVGRVILVQPSFLGTENRYLLEQLEEHPTVLRGVVVVDPNITEVEFSHMVSLGVTGVRLNIIGSTISGKDLVAQYEHLIHLINKYQCHLEIQTQGDHWSSLLPALMATNVSLVVDHFGRPAHNYNQGFKDILNSLETGNVWVKLSGSYRFEAEPSQLATQLLERAPERLVWGSDYPWTQHEAGRTYSSCLKQIEPWCNDAQLEAILVNNPATLFKFE